MGTGNYVTTLSGRNQQSNLDKIDNWETTRKYLFDRISLYTAYSDSLLIHPSDLLPEKFQMQNIYLRKTKRFQTKKSLQVAKIRNMDSVTAAEWLQCLTSKLRCCSFFQFERCYVYFEKHQGGILWFTLKNTREEKEKKAHDMETLPLKSTINYEWHTLICNFFRISIIMIDNIMISSIKSSPPSTINIQSALFRSNHSILNI